MSVNLCFVLCSLGICLYIWEKTLYQKKYPPVSKIIPIALCNIPARTQLFCYTLCLLLHMQMVWSNPKLIKQDSEVVTNIRMGPLHSQASTAPNSTKLFTVFSAITNLNRLTEFEMLHLDFCSFTGRRSVQK